MSTENNNNFTIKDNSQILSIIPKEWIEPLIIISRVKKYESVDSYVLEMIRDRLEMFIDTRDELGESFQKYMQNIEGLEGLTDVEETTITPTEDNTAEFVKQVHENYHNAMKHAKTDDKENGPCT